MHEDFLTCGGCAEEYQLSRINEFIAHKVACLQLQSPVVNSFPTAGLSCFFCKQQFHTARGMFHHMQTKHHHSLQNVGGFSTINSALTPLGTNPAYLTSSVYTPDDLAFDNNACGTMVSTAATTLTNTSCIDARTNTAITPSESSKLPAACAKLIRSDGQTSTICCNGQTCQVTIGSPKEIKKCCSAVVPKKRRRHMQEHGEQTALEVPASLRERVLLCQREKSKKQKRRAYRKSQMKRKGFRTHCILQRRKEELVCVARDCDSYEDREEEVEDRGGLSDQLCELDSSDTISDFEREYTPQKMEIFSIENEEVVSKKTVLVNSGMTVTLEPRRKQTEGVQEREASMNGATFSTASAGTNSSLINKEQITMNSNAGVSADLLELISSAASNIPDSLLVENFQMGSRDSQASNMMSLACGTNPNSAHPMHSSYAEISAPNGLTRTNKNANTLTSLNRSISQSIPEINGMNISGDVLLSRQPIDSGLNVSLVDSTLNLNSLLPENSLNVSSGHYDSQSLIQSASHTSVHAHSSSALAEDFQSVLPLQLQQTMTQQVTPHMDIHPLCDMGDLSLNILDFNQVSNGSSINMNPLGPLSVTNTLTSSSPPAESNILETQEKPDEKQKKRKYPTSRPYKCRECNQAFNQLIHLRKHMSKHTGVKPFKCEQCDYSTVERSHLKAHNRIHTGEKPFQCHFCNYATAQNSTLTVHLRRHHKDH